MNRLSVVSLFDGIGGFCRAFERAGARVAATVEINEAAAAVSARHFPNAVQFRDVTEVSADDFRAAGFIPERGVVTAGWPCQDFSVAGRRAGLDGARSGLWWEVVRVLADLKPRWFLGENVPGLLSSVCDPQCEGGCMETHGGALGAVLGSLGQLGYGVAYRVLDAQYFGVPQRRERVFIVGHLGVPWSAPAQILFEPESGEGDSAPGREAWPPVAAGVTAGAGGAGREVAPALIARYGKGSDSKGSDSFVIQKGNGALTGGVPFVVQPLAMRGREGGAELEIGPEDGPYNCLRAGDGGSSRNQLIAVSFHENERGEITTSDTAGTLKVGGGKPGQGYPAVCVTGEHTHALTSAGASEDGTGRGTPIISLAVAGDFSTSEDVAQDDTNLVASETIVRRLTELECERLQGYPDEWTEYTVKDIAEVAVPCHIVSALWPIVAENMPRTGSALCITSDSSGLEVSIYRPAAVTYSTNAASATGWLETVEGEPRASVDGTTSRGNDTVTRSRPSETSLKSGPPRSEDLNTTEKSLRLNLVAPCDPAKLSTISTWIRAMTNPPICTSAPMSPSTAEYTIHWNAQQPNFSGEDYCVLRVASTTRSSGAARYRQLCNSVAVPVVEWIARRIVAVDKEIIQGGL